jgi:tetratricopeptide (TPR) repeat protein
MSFACLGMGELERYALGTADGADRQAVEAHAASCQGCRLELAALGLAHAPGGRDEEALLAWMASTRPVATLLSDLGLNQAANPAPPTAPALIALPGGADAPIAVVTHRANRRVRGSRWALGGLVAAAAALVLVFALPRGGLDVPAVELTYRATEARPAHALGYAPFAPIRGGTDAEAEARYTRLEGQVVAQRQDAPKEADSLLTAVYLWRGAEGDQARARAILEARGPSAARENDRGVLLLSAHQAEEALAALDKALRTDPSLGAALFNRPLALESMGQIPAAIRAWEAFLDSPHGTSEGWGAEAARRLETLRATQAR